MSRTLAQRLTGAKAVNFAKWWAFCQQKGYDGTYADGPGTHWGFTFPTWQTAQAYGGYPDQSQAGFDALTQNRAELLALEYFWERLQAPSMNPGADLALIDWCWTSGGAVMEVQGKLGVAVDNVIGPKTLAAINADKTFVSDCTNWRIGYYAGLNLLEQYPGLATRATACRNVALTLGGS